MKEKIKRLWILTFIILLAFPGQAFADNPETVFPEKDKQTEGFAIVYDTGKGKYAVSVGTDGSTIGAQMREKGSVLKHMYYTVGLKYIKGVGGIGANDAQIQVIYVNGGKKVNWDDDSYVMASNKVVLVPASNYYNGWVKTSDTGQEDAANAWDSTTLFESQVNALRLVKAYSGDAYQTKTAAGATLITVMHGLAPMFLQDPLKPIESASSADFTIKRPKMKSVMNDASLKLMSTAGATLMTDPGQVDPKVWGTDGRKYGMSQFYNMLKDVPTGEYVRTVFEGAIKEDGKTTIQALADYWDKAKSETDKQNCLLYLRDILGDVDKVISDGQQSGEAGEVQGGTTDTATDGGNITEDVWDDWYRAAYKIAAGIDPATDDWKMGSGYELASNLVGTDSKGGYSAVSGEVNDRETIEFWQKAYDVMCLAYSLGPNVKAINTWDPGGTSLKHAYDMLAKVTNHEGGKAANGVQNYAVAKTKLAELASAGGETEYNRMCSFYERMSALYHMATINDVDFKNDNYSWVKDYYEANNSGIFIPNTYFTDSNTHIPKLLVFSGSVYKMYPALPAGGDSNPYVMPYLLQTVWELPYICKYMAKPMNDAIKNSTIMDRQDMYNALKSIHDTVDEMGLKVLTDMWEWETDDPDITFKSLKSMWEACQKDPKVQEAATDADDTKTDKLSTGNPLGDFLADYNTKLSDNYIKGIAYTATLVPMKSNIYSTEWLGYLGNDDDFYKNFYYLWGFNRKALYRDTTSGAGEEYYNSGKTSKGNLSVCTLRDLLNSKDDVVLYLDDNFYNANKLQTDLSGYTTYDTKEEGKKPPRWWENLSERVEESYNTSFENIVKTGESTNYSKTFYEMMSLISNAHTYYPAATVKNPGNVDNVVLNSGKINYYLGSGSTGSEIYTPLQAYAVVSSIYRNGDLYTMANSMALQKPVFVSSKTAPYATGASVEERQTIFNYALVKNLKAAMPINYAGNLDMDCPLYMDILGNIVTESGTVVVPAASNATLMSHTDYFNNMWGAGLFSIYGGGYKIPVKKDDSSTVYSVLEKAFEPDSSGKYYIPKPRSLGDDSYKVDMSRLSITSKDTLDTLYGRMYGDLTNRANSGHPLYDYSGFAQICLEVLRGAPIDAIDKDAEGLDTNNRIDRAGIVAAAKLEDLNKSLGTNGENTTLSLPNMAFMPGLNYIALFAFKIVLFVVILINMVTIYFDAVSESISIKTFWKCLWAMVLTVLTVLTVPVVFEATYYQSNRALLQDETSYISMLNLEKRESGVEIGVTDVTDPDIKTQLFLKLEDVKVPWYELFYNSIYTNTYKTLNNLYANYAQEHSAVANQADVEIKNDGVYVDVNKIYDSSSVDFDIKSDDANSRRLIQTAKDKTSTFSYYSPYYAILDALIQNVNYYNENPRGDKEPDVQGWYSYTTKAQKGGRLKTVGLIEPYFTSSKFMEDDAKDTLGFKTIYKDLISDDYEQDPATRRVYSSGNMLAMSRSYWYPVGMTDTEVSKRISYLVKDAREFVANNKDMLGKISDETFLKVMAMNLAIKHNRIFGCSMASSFEIYNLSSDDLIRLSIADRTSVMLNSTLSYPRFVYVVGGTSSVFAAAMLSMIMWISGIVKPLLVIIAFITIFLSIFIFKVCMRKEGTSLYGYVITTLLLCLTNVLYSVILKLSMYLPTLGMTPFMCLVIQAIVQLAYLVILLKVVGTAFRDWRDLGYERYAHKADDMKISIFNFLHKDKDNSTNPFYGGTQMKSDPEKNWSYYDKMMEERKRRSRDG